MSDKVFDCISRNGAGYDKLSEMNQIETQLFILFLSIAIHRPKWNGLPKEIPSWCLEKVVNLYGQGVLFKYGDRYLVTSAVNSALLDVYNEPCEVQPVAMNGMSFERVRVKDVVVSDNGGLLTLKQNAVLIKNNLYSIPTYAMIKPYIKKLCWIWESAGINAGLSRLVALIHCNKDVSSVVKSELTKIIGSKTGICVVNEKMNVLESIEKLDLKVEYTPEKYWEDFDNTFNLICLMLGITTDMNKNKKERVVVAQVESNDEVTSIIADSYIDFRKSACEECKEVFGLDISVEEKKDIKLTNPNDDNVIDTQENA